MKGTHETPPIAALQEVADVLAAHGAIPCTPRVDHDGDHFVLRVSFPRQVGLEEVELLEQLRRVQDVAQMRAFADRYGIPPERLEAFIAGGPWGSTPCPA